MLPYTNKILVKRTSLHVGSETKIDYVNFHLCNIILATSYFYRGACAIFGGKFCKENYSFVTINKVKIYKLYVSTLS